MSAARVGLFKRAWNEIPEIVGSTFMAGIGIVLTISAVYTYYAKDGDNRPYKTEYTVFREGTPEAEKARRTYSR